MLSFHSTLLILHQLTPLHLASKNGHILIVKELLHKGADKSIKSYQQKEASELAKTIEISSYISNYVHVPNQEKHKPNKKLVAGLFESPCSDPNSPNSIKNELASVSVQNKKL